MVKLLIDVGNSCCKKAAWDGTGYTHYATTTAEDPASCLSGDLDVTPTGIWISSVRNESFNRGLTAALGAEFDLMPLFAQVRPEAFGMTTRYGATLGVDRFLGLVAAWRRFRCACVVVDCGTAVTLDALDARGVHRGGLIMPGLNTLKQSLYDKADRLPAPDDDERISDPKLFATDTATAIESGCLRMWQQGIRTVSEDMLRALGAQPCGDDPIICSGGDSGKLPEGSRHFKLYPNLVFDGLLDFFSGEEETA